LMVQGGKTSNSTTALSGSSAGYTIGSSYFAGMQHTF